MCREDDDDGRKVIHVEGHFWLLYWNEVFGFCILLLNSGLLVNSC